MRLYAYCAAQLEASFDLAPSTSLQPCCLCDKRTVRKGERRREGEDEGGGLLRRPKCKQGSERARDSGEVAAPGVRIILLAAAASYLFE